MIEADLEGTHISSLNAGILLKLLKLYHCLLIKLQISFVTRLLILAVYVRKAGSSMDVFVDLTEEGDLCTISHKYMVDTSF